jgi:hypothetical protein
LVLRFGTVMKIKAPAMIVAFIEIIVLKSVAPFLTHVWYVVDFDLKIAAAVDGTVIVIIIKETMYIPIE